MNKHLCWEPQYAFEKIFPLTTRWQLLHLPDFTLDERLSMTDLFIPDNIKKIRNIKSIASYEIIWKKEHTVIEMLNEYKEQTKENDYDVDDNLLTSIEPQDLVLKCYPELVEIYENTRNVKSKKRTANSRKKKATINDNNKDSDIGTKDTTKSKQKKVKKKTEKNNRKIDEFISGNQAMSLEESFERMAITPKRSKRENISNRMDELKIRDVPEDAAITNIKQMKCGPQFKRVLEIQKLNSKLNNTFDKMFDELSPGDFMSENEDNDLDVTHVIENICSKQTFQLSITNCQFIESTSRSIENTEEYTKTDELESVTYIKENYVHTQDERRKSDHSDDEFDINESYIPINQRIQIGESQKFLSTGNQTERRGYSFDFENIMDQTDDKSTYLDT